MKLDWYSISVHGFHFMLDEQLASAYVATLGHVIDPDLSHGYKCMRVVCKVDAAQTSAAVASAPDCVQRIGAERPLHRL